MFYDAPRFEFTSDVSAEGFLALVRAHGTVEDRRVKLQFGIAQGCRGEVEEAGTGCRVALRYQQGVWVAAELCLSATAAWMVWTAPSMLVPVLPGWLVLGLVLRQVRRRIRFRTEARVAALFSDAAFRARRS
jgi:hypothetical protein